MNKTLIMLKMGWTERQYYEDNTAESISQISFILEKMNKVREFEDKSPKRKAKVNVQMG